MSDQLPENISNDLPVSENISNDVPAVMDGSQVEQEITRLARELDSIEDSITQELDILQDNLGEEFSVYARFVKSIGENLHEIAMQAKNQKMAYKVALLTEAVNLGILTFGRLHSVWTYNRQLDKLMAIKKSIAAGRLEAMHHAIPVIERSLKTSNRLLMRFAELDIPNKVAQNEEDLALKANQGMRIMEIFRAASFFHKLSTYIALEAEAWTRGEHTAGIPLPGYSNVYAELEAELYNQEQDAMVNEYCNMLSGNIDKLKGRHLLLASDPQGTAYILNKSVYLVIEPDSTPLGKLIAANPMTEIYNENVGRIANHINENPTKPSLSLMPAIIVSLLGVLMILFGMDINWWAKGIISIFFLLGIWSTWDLYNEELEETFYYGYNDMLHEGNILIKQEAGYVQQPKRNFKKKSYWEEFKKLLFEP